MNPKQDKATEILGSWSRGEKAKRDVEILSKMSEILHKSEKIKCTYRGNEKDPEWIDYYLGSDYIESVRVQPQVVLDLRAAKIEQGFRSGITYALSQILEMIQKDRIENEKKTENESK